MFFWALSAAVLLRLVFFEELGLIQRSITENRIHSLAGLTFYHALYIVFFALLSLPFVLGFATIYRASGRDLLWLGKYRSKSALIGALAATIGLSVYLLFQPVYDGRWCNDVLVEQRFDLGADSSRIELKASEYLDGTEMRSGNRQRMIAGRTDYQTYSPTEPSTVHWASLERRTDTANAEGDSVVSQRDIQLHSLLRPYTVTISYRSELPFTVQSRWAHGGNVRLGRETDRFKIFSWYSFPDTNLEVPIAFGLVKGQRIAERVEVTYDSLAYDLHLSRKFMNVQYRTVVAAIDTFSSDRHQPLREGVMSEGRQ